MFPVLLMLYASRLPLDSFQNARGVVVVRYAFESLRTAVVQQILMKLHRVLQNELVYGVEGDQVQALIRG